LRTFDKEIFGENQDFVTETKWGVRRTVFVCRNFRGKLSKVERMAKFVMNSLKMVDVSLDKERRNVNGGMKRLSN
jgi:hypothetical protein